MSQLFAEKRWIGEFFLPDSYEQRFFGEIQYSPEEGVTLSFTTRGFITPAVTQVVHGVLSTGHRCTLIGSFPPSGAGFIDRTGEVTRSGKARFSYLAIGDFLAEDEQFTNVDFTLTNLQEFFFPKHRKDFVKHCELPMYSVDTPFGQLKVASAAQFNSLPGDITAHIYSYDSAALAALDLAFKEVKTKHPDSHFGFKKDIAYRIYLRFDTKTSIRDAYKQLTSVSNLFALLICCPVYPDSIRVLKQGAEEPPIALELYPTMRLDPRTIKLSTRDHDHQRMPIRQSTVPLDSIMKTWFQTCDNHASVISSIQHETGFRNTHTAHGEIVLYATQFESISHEAKQKTKKYEYPLASYSSERLRNGLMEVFGMSSLEDVAVEIGSLRNEIAHVGKPKQWLVTLSLGQLLRISRYMQLTIIAYTLTEIGVPKDVIDSYQNAHSPDP